MSITLEKLILKAEQKGIVVLNGRMSDFLKLNSKDRLVKWLENGGV